MGGFDPAPAHLKISFISAVLEEGLDLKKHAYQDLATLTDLCPMIYLDRPPFYHRKGPQNNYYISVGSHGIYILSSGSNRIDHVGY